MRRNDWISGKKVHGSFTNIIEQPQYSPDLAPCDHSLYKEEFAEGELFKRV